MGLCIKCIRLKEKTVRQLGFLAREKGGIWFEFVGWCLELVVFRVLLGFGFRIWGERLVIGFLKREKGLGS